jgi:L-cysteine/cystine lyase
VVAPFLPDAEKLAAVRAALPALGAGLYLNTGSVGPLPSETIAAMREVEDRDLRFGRAHPRDRDDLLARLDEARAAAAAIVGAPLEAIGLTHSTSDGLNAVAWGIDWADGDRAVTTNHEHPGGLGPLERLRDRRGVDLAIVDIGDGGDADAILAAFEMAVTPRTRLVALSEVLWTTGARLPVARIAALAHERDALVAIDGAQAAGALPVDVARLGVDAYAFPAQKWLLGPEGMGALYVAPGVEDRIRATFGGWLTYASIERTGAAAVHPGGRRFEATNFHGPSAVGFARSCGWLSMFVGLDWLLGRGPTLARAAADRLGAIEGVSLVTPTTSMATLVTFRVAGWTADAALAELGARAHAIARSIPDLDALRISVGAFNTEAEIERLALAVELLATHDPEHLPPRRLVILGEDA